MKAQMTQLLSDYAKNVTLSRSEDERAHSFAVIALFKVFVVIQTVVSAAPVTVAVSCHRGQHCAVVEVKSAVRRTRNASSAVLFVVFIIRHFLFAKRFGTEERRAELVWARMMQVVSGEVGRGWRSHFWAAQSFERPRITV